MYWPSMPELFDSPRKASKANGAARQTRDSWAPPRDSWAPGVQKRRPHNEGVSPNTVSLRAACLRGPR
jgi:hypothetical protein